VSAVASLLIGLGRTTGGYILAAGGVVLGQGRLLVHPDGILHEWRRYWYLHPDAGCDAPVAAPTAALRFDVTPLGFAGGGGIGFSLRF
jgi:hypothetical protein